MHALVPASSTSRARTSAVAAPSSPAAIPTMPREVARMFGSPCGSRSTVHRLRDQGRLAAAQARGRKMRRPRGRHACNAGQQGVAVARAERQLGRDGGHGLREFAARHGPTENGDAQSVRRAPPLALAECKGRNGDPARRADAAVDDIRASDPAGECAARLHVTLVATRARARYVELLGERPCPTMRQARTRRSGARGWGSPNAAH